MPAAADALLIAVVDDDSLFRDTISANLREAGYRAITFDNGPAIVDWFAKGNRSAALLLDWQMPVQDGPTTLEQLRAAGHALPVIFLTGLNQPIFEEKGLKLGAVDFFEKPYDDEALLAAVRSALTRQHDDSDRQAAAAAIRARLASLSHRERQVLDGLVAGHPNKVIAHNLQISPRTIEIYRANVMTKMQASSLSELVRMAVLSGS